MTKKGNDNLLDKLLLDDEKIDEVNLNEEEENELIGPLLREIGLIQDPNIRSFVRAILLRASPLFWVVPGTFGKEAPPDEYGIGGNVLHTQRVVRCVELICEAQDRTPHETDLLLAAAILHDITKCIESSTGEPIYDPLHPYTVDALVKGSMMEDSHHANPIRSTTWSLDDESIAIILRLIHCHLGYFSAIPETFPLTGMDWTLHLSDFICSKAHYIVDGPEVIAEKWLGGSDIPKET